MTRRYRQQGEVLTLTATETVTAGQLYQQGRFFGLIVETDGVTPGTAVTGEQFQLLVEDVIKAPKATGGGTGFDEGDAAYFKAGDGTISNSAADGPLVGAASEAAADGDEDVYVRLNESCISDDQAENAALAAIKTGTLTIASGANNGTASVGAAFNGKPVFLTLQGSAGDGKIAAATPTPRGVVAGGTLTVTLLYKDGAATNNASSGAQTWAYLIDGR